MPVKDERVINCIKAALGWMKAHNVRWITSENKIYSRCFGYAGTSDGLCLCDSCKNNLCCPEVFIDRLSLIDWKSSGQLYLEFLFQTAAYQNALVEEHRLNIIDRWIIRLGKEDGAFESWHVGPEHFDRDFQAFLCTLELSRSVADIKARIDAQKDELRAADKQAAKESLKIKCKNANKYKGVRYPTCNQSNPCEYCINLYNEKHKGL